MIREFLIQGSFLIAVFCFITGIKMMSKPDTAKVGNRLSAGGMLLAVIATLFQKQIVSGFLGIVIGLTIGGIAGLVVSRFVVMTAIPELVALLHGFGGSASLLVGAISFLQNPHMNVFTSGIVFLAISVGGLTFSGSLIAWAKLRDFSISKPTFFPAHYLVSTIVLLTMVGSGIALCFPSFQTHGVLYLIIALSLLFGITAVLPIGGADMPVVISLLNAYSGVAVCATGFVIHNHLLIVAGALLGANGTILTQVMCKAMNRSLKNIVLGGFGTHSNAKLEHKTAKVYPVSVEDAYLILEAAGSVVVVPGYGMAVAQAQHMVKELGALLENRGCDVKYAIHPVAGRMPGHMNVLLAEAGVSYDQLYEMDSINPMLETTDVCLVIGANDTVNPAARDDKESPIFGMPIINVDKAKTVIVMKRSMASGFAGIDNPLFGKENTRMLFGDAKSTVQSLTKEFKEI